MAVRQLTVRPSDGTNFGYDATDKIGFHGATPVVQGAVIADATDAATALTRVNLVIARLRANGLIAT